MQFASANSTERTCKLSRRKFGQLAAAAAVGTAAESSMPLGAAAESDAKPFSDAVDHPISAAVIGCGGIATHHARVNFAPWFQIDALCDVDRRRAEMYRAVAPDAKTVCSDYRELLERDDIEAFFVCTPDHWHTKVTIDAMRHGKNVYCEKPLTFSVDEGRVVRQVANETGRVLQVGTQQRSDPKFQTAVALARSGRLGDVKRVTVAIGGGPSGGPFETADVPDGLDWDRWLGQAPMTDYLAQRCHGSFRWWYEYSGGKLTDWGAHHVDIALWALGWDAEKSIEIEVLDVVHPVAMKDGWPTDRQSFNTANRFTVRCVLPGDAELIIRDNAADLGFDNGILFECERGRFFVNRNRLAGKPIEDLRRIPLTSRERADIGLGNDAVSHMENFYRSCHGHAVPISDFESHIRHLNVCHVANIGLRLGENLRWSAAEARITNHPQANDFLVRPQRSGFEVV